MAIRPHVSAAFMPVKQSLKHNFGIDGLGVAARFVN